MKGIILAGGLGSRLHPMTKVISKQLLPVYDKPMIYYPLSTLMLANIKDILIISTEEALPLFQNLFGNGSHLGLNISYKMQDYPRGLADSFILGEEFIGSDNAALILGDNIYYGNQFSKILLESQKEEGATVFAYRVKDPKRFGVIEFDDQMKAVSVEEKPEEPKSNYAVTGLYFYDNKVVSYAKSLKPSNRGEIEITDLNRIYLEEGKLNVSILGRGFAWFDSGTPDALMEASSYIHSIEKNQGIKISCIEEIAYNKGFINKEQLIDLTKNCSKSEYSCYLKSLLLK